MLCAVDTTSWLDCCFKHVLKWGSRKFNKARDVVQSYVETGGRKFSVDCC